MKAKWLLPIRRQLKRLPGARKMHVKWRELRLPSDSSELFTEIYRRGSWDGTDSLSGPGSDALQTEVLLEELPQLLRELGVTTMLDLPCGDFFWMKSVDLGEIDYVGADIVPDAVERNQQLFAGANRRFKTLDVTTDSLPKVDLVLCRDCLVHFSDRDIVRAVSNLRRSGSRYLLTTTYIDRALNRNIATGDWRPLNLEREPFSFPPPLRLIDEKCTEEGGRFSDKSLALWKLDSLPTARL